MRSIYRVACGLLAAAMMVVTGAAEASTYTANVTNASSSAPKLNAAGNAWEPFSSAQGDPNSGKSIKVLYLADDFTATGSPPGFRASGPAPRVPGFSACRNRFFAESWSSFPKSSACAGVESAACPSNRASATARMCLGIPKPP